LRRPTKPVSSDRSISLSITAGAVRRPAIAKTPSPLRLGNWHNNANL
jgi:hypothetical protein